MSIYCTTKQDRGTTSITGSGIPDGDAVLTRTSPGEQPYLLRDGAFTVDTGGFIRDDTEPPFGVPLTYRLSMTVDDRLIQRNLVPTPTFLHGVQGWLAGVNRTLAVQPDATAHSAQVGHVTGNPAGLSPPVPPAFVGHADAALVTGPYTITAPTSGGGSVAAGDWQFLVHQQPSATALPAAPAGWTQVVTGTAFGLSLAVWKRKRVGGDAGVSVAAGATVASIGTLLWFRSAGDVPLVSVVTSDAGATGIDTATVSVIDPSQVLTVAVGQTLVNAAPPAAGSVSGAVWQYTVASGTSPRTTTIALAAKPNAGTTTAARVNYDPTTALSGALAVQIAVPAVPTPPTARIIARAKTTALPARPDPYRLTGRVRFNTSDLWLWLDVRNAGNWSVIKAKGTWADVRGASAAAGTSYIRFFVSITDPATGNDYVAPVQAITINPPSVNTWVDFSFNFTTAVDIPATAEIRFLHGTNLREYAVEWWLDEIGITSPDELAPHRNPLYWFDGDTPVPATPAPVDIWQPDGAWTALSNDASITWSGTAGNSISVFNGPSKISTSTTCQLDGPASTPDGYCLPVFINDPVSPALAQWFSLITIDPLDYAARQTLYDAINRAPVVAVSQIRAWATGQLTLLTRTLAERSMALNVFATGRIVFYRNPDPAFPENSWYLAVGNVNEARVLPDARRPERLWTVPFARVERPSGLIDSQTGVIWQTVQDGNPNWLAVATKNEDWLQVLTGIASPASLARADAGVP
jgi:hypothetical protein